MTQPDEILAQTIDFRLLDAEEFRRFAPSTYEIPPRSLRHALGPGDVVKLVFEVVDGPYDVRSERMWVKVAQVIGGRYVGTLANHPVAITSVMLHSPIEFGPQHVIDLA